MARALLVFLGLVALAAAGAWLADHPGLVSVQWGGRRIETDTAVAVAAVLVLIFVVAFLARFWRWLMTSPMALATLRAEGRRRKGYQALSRGLVAVAAGDVGQAKKLARRTADLLDDPPLTLLLSAQAAQLDGDEGAARDYFAAMREQPETEFLGLRGLLVQARRAGDGAEALRLARRAFELRPDTPWVLQELFGLEAAAGNWPAARKLVDQAAKRKLLDGAAADRRRALVLFAQALAAEAQGETKRALELARKAHGLAADFVPATAMAGRLHGAANDGRKARRLLREGWQRLPHPELLAAWRSLDPQQQPAARLQAVRELTADNPGHEESRVALAEAAIAAGQWDLARDQLQALMDGAPSVRVGRLFADLEEAESGD
ncbi:MAG: heme biosynthesis HemY N-terminal domain-containing protein, partial [Alphaproteobacteria bacterium]|nr:heme biosynthesis HemY N-terminal domain-containing protein [Alphaproteobacteria bacterium]